MDCVKSGKRIVQHSRQVSEHYKKLPGGLTGYEGIVADTRRAKNSKAREFQATAEEARVPYTLRGEKSCFVLQAVDELGVLVPRLTLLSDSRRAERIGRMIGLKEPISVLSMAEFWGVVDKGLDPLTPAWGCPDAALELQTDVLEAILEVPALTYIPVVETFEVSPPETGVFGARVTPRSFEQLTSPTVSGVQVECDADLGGTGVNYVGMPNMMYKAPDVTLTDPNPKAVSFPQTCSNCGRPWTCTKSPPEVHGLCKECERDSGVSVRGAFLEAEVDESQATYVRLGTQRTKANINPRTREQRQNLPTARFETAAEEAAHLPYRDIVNPFREDEYEFNTKFVGPKVGFNPRIWSEVKDGRKPPSYTSGPPVAIASMICKGSRGPPVELYLSEPEKSSGSEDVRKPGYYDSSSSESEKVLSGSELDSEEEAMLDEKDVSLVFLQECSEACDRGEARLPMSRRRELAKDRPARTKRKHLRVPEEKELVTQDVYGTDSSSGTCPSCFEQDVDTSEAESEPEVVQKRLALDEAVRLFKEDPAKHPYPLMTPMAGNQSSSSSSAGTEGSLSILEVDPVIAQQEKEAAERFARTKERARKYRGKLHMQPRLDKAGRDQRALDVIARDDERETQRRALLAALSEEDRDAILEEEELAEAKAREDHGREYLVWRVTRSVLNFISKDKDFEDVDTELTMKIRDLCTKAYSFGDNKLAEKDAVKWADNFQFPEQAVEDDEAAFLAAGNSIEELARLRLEGIADVRMSVQSVIDVCTEGNPDTERLKELAQLGMDLLLPPEYVANNLPTDPVDTGPCDNLSSSYKETRAAVDKMIFNNFYKKGLAVVLKQETVKEHVGTFSTAVARWARKAQKPQGRNIHDASAKAKGQLFALNNHHSKQACKDKYGVIENPTMQAVVCMVFEFWEREKKKNPNVKWKDLRIWKMDLAGAFTLLRFQIEMVRHVGLALAGGLIVFFLCGVFGWTGTPGCFQVVNRVLMFEAAKLLRGLALMFCDDVMGVCFVQDVEHEQGVLHDLISRLFNTKDAVADDKTESGRDIVILGFNVNLDTLVASIADKNLFNAVYGFMELQEDKLVAFKEMEKMASWAALYGQIAVHMNPMVRLLYRELKGKHRGRSWHLSRRAKIAVWFFRAMFIATNVCGTQFCRPLWSMRNLYTWLYVAEFDSCLTGIGCIWYVLTPDGKEIAVGAASWDISAMGFKESNYQNTCEFMGAIMCLVGLIRYGMASKPFLLRGDSKSALSWAVKRRYRGDLTVPAGFLFNYIWVTWQVLLSKCEHLPGVKNSACDDLSRPYTKEDEEEITSGTGCVGNVPRFRKLGASDNLLPVESRRYSADMSVVGDRSECVNLKEFMAICDPNQTWDTEEDFGVFWQRMVKWCDRVLGEIPEPWSPNPKDHA